MDPEYIDYVKDWVKLDNVILRNNVEVKVAEEDIKRIKDRVVDQAAQKKEIEQKILEYIQTNKLNSMQLKISDGIITFGKKTTQKPITQKFLKEILQKYSDDEENIPFQKIFDFILSNIEKKIEYTINRNIKDK